MASNAASGRVRGRRKPSSRPAPRPRDAISRPFSEELERAVLAAVLLGEPVDPSPKLFYQERHQLIADAASRLREAGMPVDVRTVEGRLKLDGTLERVGGVGYLAGLDLALPDLGRTNAYMAQLAELRRRRDVLDLTERLASAAHASSAADFVQQLDRLAELAATPALSGEALPPGYRTLAQMLEDPAATRPPEVVVPRMAWEGRVTLLAGREKLGKSTIATAAAAAVSRGGAFLDGKAKAGRVVWLALEEHPADVVQRLRRFRAEPDAVLVGTGTPDPLTGLEGSVAAWKPQLVVIDTLAALVEKDAPESGSASDWTPTMLRIARLARRSSAGIELLHHARRSDGKYRDSTAIGASVDVIMELQPAKGDASERRLEAKGRFPVSDFAVRLDEDGAGFALAAGELTLDAQVLACVTRSPGSSLREVRGAIEARGQAVDAALERLARAGAIKDRGSGNRRSFYLVETDS